MRDHWILDKDGSPQTTDMMTWARWFEDGERRILARTDLPSGGFVSTVFLGIDHGWGEGDPVLWETMAFDAGVDDMQRRYTSREGALAGHAEIVAELSGAE